MTPGEVNRLLLDAKRDLDDAQDRLAAAVLAAAEAENAYEKAHAVRYITLRADTSVKWTEKWLEAEIRADRAIGDLETVMVLAKAQETNAKRSHDTASSGMSAAQTMASLLREEMRFTGADGRP